MQMTRVFFDMDGVIAQYKEVPPEELYREGYFAQLEPCFECIGALALLAADPQIEVHTLSAVLPDSKYALAEKQAWFDRYLRQYKITPIFMYCGESKREKVPGGILPSDILIDDYNENLRDWSKEAVAIKFLNGINDRHGSWQGARAGGSAAEIAAAVYGQIRKVS